jgi:hypothetical protein
MNRTVVLGRQRAGRVGWYLWLVIVLASSLGLAWAAGEGLEQEFLVNSLTDDRQLWPDVAMDTGGDFVVVWTSESSAGNDQSGYSVQARLFGADGVPRGEPFQVNSYTDNNQLVPSVAMDGVGNFVVVWVSKGSPGDDNSDTSIQGQRYDQAGIAQGEQFQVNQFISRGQNSPDVAMNDQGDFVVVWDWMHDFLGEAGQGGDTNLRSVQGRRFDAMGQPIGGEFQVNTTSAGWQELPAVAMNHDGSFVVTWVSDEEPVEGVVGQRYNAAGEPVGGEFQVNTYANSGSRPDVAMSSGGYFVVVWNGFNSSIGPDVNIQGQLFDAAGQPVGSQFQVNSYLDGLQQFARVAMDDEGRFLVTWSSMGSAGSDQDGFRIQGQHFAANGAMVGGEFQVNQYTGGDQQGSAVAMGMADNVVIAWTSESFPPGGDPDEAVVAVHRSAALVMTVAPPEQVIEAGGSAVYTLSLSGSYSGTVTIAADAPAELEAVLSETAVSLPAEVMLTLTDLQTMGALRPGGWYEVAVTATAGESVQTVTVQLLVGGGWVYLPVVMGGNGTQIGGGR